MKRRWKGRFMKEGKHARLQSLSDKTKNEAEEADDTPEFAENDFVDSIESGWGIGRRIVELGHLANQMKACVNCKNPLFLHKIKSEKRVGYASILYIDCDCGVINSVTTGKSHRPPDKMKKGMPIYDINTKATLGVMHAGVNYRQMNALMATMELKGLHHSTMMRRREEIEPHIESVAEESCLSALTEEVKSNDSTSCLEKIGETESNTTPQPEGIFKYDMGWQKRGSGRAYDSKSGVGTLIGNSCGKICAFGVRQSDCRMCLSDKENIVPHKCTRNWTGSAKAMEPDVGIELIKSVEKEGVKVSTLIMDDDTTTMARIRNELNHSVTKWSDVNHTSKHLSNSLFQLQKKHKHLNNSVIAYLKKCFNYALAQTKGNVEQCRKQINQIVPHAFGEHSSCGDWCGYKINPEEYKHQTLTKDLTGDDLRSDLVAIFNVFSQNSEKIAPGGSTKDVESFNNMVATKAPKRCHFSSTGNLKSRVGCAVAQKNLGNTYISVINKKVGLSPGRVYQIEAERRDTERKRQRKYINERHNKLRKIRNKIRKKLEVSYKEKKEGKTYHTAIDTTLNQDPSIPLPSKQPVLEPVQSISNLVFCDIESGSLHKDCDILQVAACYEQKTFNAYIKPTKQISPGASKVTGLTSQGGVLFLNGSPVTTLPMKDAFQDFITWLREIGNVVLVGHNFKVFDFPRLIRGMKKVGLESEFSEVCKGGVDTLPIFRQIYPEAEKHKQEFLLEHIMNIKYSAHNALDDVISLEKLFRHSNPCAEIITKYSFSTVWGFHNLTHQEATSQNAITMQCLIDKKVISKQTATKIASSGLCFIHLEYTFKQSGAAGLVQLLSDNSCGEPRVTANKKILEKIQNFFLDN